MTFSTVVPSMTGIRFPLILLCCVSVSCATPPNIRDTQPTRVEMIPANYHTLANCVTQQIDVTGVARKARISVNEKEKHITLSEPFGFEHNKMKFEFVFSQVGEHQTKVESYGYETLVGRNHYPNQVWPYVMECAGQGNPETQATFPGMP